MTEATTLRYTKLFSSLVKIEHTLFALPFAYVGAFLAVDGVPSAHDLVWVTVAMAGARSFAMALNRLIDAGIDARNPRTAGREIPRGALLRWQVIAFALGSLAVFLVAVYQLAPIVHWLWPIPVVGFVVYPYLKRVTWLCHFWLGVVDGLAPLGAWAAITNELPWPAWLLGGAVAFWVTGFDLLYALFDLDVDRAQGLHSFPARFGVRATFLVSRLCHVAHRRAARRHRSRARGRRALLARRRRGRAPPRLRAVARLAPGLAPARHGVLHHERRDLARLLRVRPRRGARVISARGLGKRFGEKEVLTDVSLELPPGGFLLVTGRNGAGKSTLLRLFARLLAPSEGELLVAAERRALGYVGHDPLVYRELTGLENLELYGRLYRVPERRERIGMLLERYGLWEARHERVQTYSRGMQQRLSLCRALLHEPELLLLDEPYAGLDREGAAILDGELRELAKERTFAVSSHEPERLTELATLRLELT